MPKRAKVPVFVTPKKSRGSQYWSFLQKQWFISYTKYNNNKQRSLVMALSLNNLSENQFVSTVMIIDDQSSSLHILSETLRNIDSNIVIKPLQHATDALSEARISPPDLIITDL